MALSLHHCSHARFQFKTDTDGVLKNIEQEINHALASAIEGMADQRSAFEESATAASSAFEQQNESLGKIGQVPVSSISVSGS